MRNFLAFSLILLALSAINEANSSNNDKKQSGDLDPMRYDAFMRRFQQRERAARKARSIRTAKNGQNQTGKAEKDMAATVVEAAISSVIESLTRKTDRPTEQHAPVSQVHADQPVGAILGSGDVAVDENGNPLRDVPVANDAKDERPSTSKKGFLATLVDSFNLYFSPITNFFGKFIINIGKWMSRLLEDGRKL